MGRGHNLKTASAVTDARLRLPRVHSKILTCAILREPAAGLRERPHRFKLSSALVDSIPRAISGWRSSVVPVIISAAGLSRKHTLQATSTGRMIRFRGSPGSASLSQSSPPFLTMRSFSLSVSVQPMLMPFTRIPYCASSVALFAVSTFRAALDAEYALMNGAPPLAATELMLTTAPGDFCAIQCFARAWVKKNGARVLMSNCLSNISGVVSNRFPRSVVPAAFTSP
mmetsp:Transcript_27902/g.73062  ORF Transcript_27902/g.73062 Transcript_27902/m.73062 type:complete len:227 (+) Transcript_27902:301-981(+)